MPHYISLLKWSATGRAGARRGATASKRASGRSRRGGKLVGVYVTLGQYDVVEIFEAPDDAIALEIITKLKEHGGGSTETLRALTRDEAEQLIRKL